MLEPLNLPVAPLSLSKMDGKLYAQCILRRKRILLTPEEWVRQHLIYFFINELKYPQSLIHIEKSIKIQRLSKRADLVVHGRHGEPVLLVECKAPQVAINEETFLQIANYNSHYQCRYVIASNGIIHLIYRIDGNGEINLLEEFPNWNQLLQINN
jgi:hypothetical protein